MAEGQSVFEDPEVRALFNEDKGLTLEITFRSQEQAEAFVAKNTQAGGLVALDLEDAEVRAWFDDPGSCTCEITFPGAALADLNVEAEAARSVGAEVKVAIPMRGL